MEDGGLKGEDLAVVGALREECGDGGVECWVGEMGDDVGERLEDEATQMETRVRDLESVGGEGEVVVEKDVDVDGARGIGV